MFVPVACLHCGKLFQVRPAAAGTDVPCPWCRATTAALPVADTAPAATPGPAAQSPAAAPAVSALAPEPLSLDDAEPIPPPRVTVPVPRPPLPRPGWPKRKVAAVVAGLVLVAAATAVVLGYRSGRVSSGSWAPFAAPDGSFTALFLGTPSMTPVEANPLSAVTRGGEEYAAAGWYSGVRVWVGWQDLDPAWAKSIADDKDGAWAGPVLEAERDRRVKAAGGTVAKEGTLRTSYGRGLVVQTDTPRGKRVEHYILAAAGARPRLYVVGVEAPKLDPDGPLPQKVLTGFRINGGVRDPAAHD